MGFKFTFPSQTTIVGATQSGKTTLMQEICNNTAKYFDKSIDRIFWFSACGAQSGVPQIDDRLIVVEGPPDMDLIRTHRGENSILVLDDLMSYFSSNKSGREVLNKIFTVWSHHLNLAVFNLIQAAFQLDRTSRINSTYLVLMKSHSDTLQIRNLLAQLFGKQFHSALEAYEDAMTTPYNHLLIDSHPMTDKRHRLLTDITSDNPTVYVARSV